MQRCLSHILHGGQDSDVAAPEAAFALGLLVDEQKGDRDVLGQIFRDDVSAEFLVGGVCVVRTVGKRRKSTDNNLQDFLFFWRLRATTTRKLERFQGKDKLGVELGCIENVGCQRSVLWNGERLFAMRFCAAPPKDNEYGGGERLHTKCSRAPPPATT